MLPGEEGRRFSQELGLHPQFADLLLELTEPGPLRKRQRRLVINVLGPIPVDPAPERPLIHVDLTSDLSDRTRCLDHHLHRFFLELWRKTPARFRHSPSLRSGTDLIRSVVRKVGGSPGSLTRLRRGWRAGCSRWSG